MMPASLCRDIDLVVIEEYIIHEHRNPEAIFLFVQYIDKKPNINQ